MVKNPPASAGDAGLIPGLGRSPGGGHDNPPCSCRGGPWTAEPGGRAIACGVAKESDMT